MILEHKKLLTLCTAAYNAEKYIGAMIESVIASKRQSELELLIINDGSKDQTEEIILKYHEQYSDMIRYIPKENGGAGSAWNIGMQKASGKYFKLLDADDYVDSVGLGKLLDVLREENSDLVLTNYTKVYFGRKEPIDFKNEVLPAVKQDISYFRKLKFTMHAATFRTEILKQHGMQLTERVPYTDFQFIMFPVPFVNFVSYYDINVYMYHLGVEGQSVSDEVKLRHLDVLAEVIDVVVRYYVKCREKGSLNQGQQSMMMQSILLQYRDMMKLYLRNGKSDRWEKVRAFDKRVGLTDETIKAETGKYSAVKLIRSSDYRLCRAVSAWYRIKYRLYRLLTAMKK